MTNPQKKKREEASAEISEDDRRKRMAELDVEPAAEPVDDDDDEGDEPIVEASATPEELDADEAEFRAIRRDLPGVKGAGAAGIVTISVNKKPFRNEFFRTHPDFRPLVPIVDHEVGMEKHHFAVTHDMIEPLASIGITVSDHILYLIVTPKGATRIIPVRQGDGDMEQDEYSRTKEIGLIDAISGWQRIYRDAENRCYKVYPAPAGRYGEPQFPLLKPGKIFRLGFKDKGRLIDSTEHPLFKLWAARDSD
jgi:hypothetical protein